MIARQEPDAAQVGRRIRAALALSGQKPEQIAPELNLSSRTLDRTLTGTRRPSDWELGRIAELTKVPLWFLTDGIDQPAVQEEMLETLLDEVRALSRRFDTTLEPRLATIEDELRQLARESRARSEI